MKNRRENKTIKSEFNCIYTHFYPFHFQSNLSAHKDLHCDTKMKCSRTHEIGMKLSFNESERQSITQDINHRWMSSIWRKNVGRLNLSCDEGRGEFVHKWAFCFPSIYNWIQCSFYGFDKYAIIYHKTTLKQNDFLISKSVQLFNEKSQGNLQK